MYMQRRMQFNLKIHGIARFKQINANNIVINALKEWLNQLYAVSVICNVNIKAPIYKDIQTQQTSKIRNWSLISSYI